jgi:hypothetical protein
MSGDNTFQARISQIKELYDDRKCDADTILALLIKLTDDCIAGTIELSESDMPAIRAVLQSFQDNDR